MPIELIYSFTLALFITIALIPLLIRFSAQLNLMDDPGAERKVHSEVMPRSGGLGIVLGVFIPLIFLLPLDRSLQTLFLGCFIIIFFGLLDDRHELSYKWKLFGQSLAVVLVMSGGVVIHKIPFMGFDAAPVWFTYPLTYFFLLGIINGVNFSDGLDGLAAGTILLALVLISILALKTGDQPSAIIALTVAGGILGFLRYNTFPARIFMGDSGSQFLGFITACLAVIVTQSDSSALNPFLPIIILGIPIMDIIQVVCVRIKKNLPLPGPDKEHFHHQLVKLGLRHYEVVAVIYILQLVLMAAAYVMCYYHEASLLVFYLAYFLVVMGAIYYAHSSGWQLRTPKPDVDGVERRNKILRKMNWLYHNSAILMELSIVIFFVLATWLVAPVSSSLQSSALIVAAFLFVFVLAGRKWPQLTTRACCYSVSVLLMYLLIQHDGPEHVMLAVNAYLIGMVLFLVLVIRMTRRTDFSLDTQDLLVLLLVIILPQLPIAGLDESAIGNVTLQLAVLLYSCEFLLGRNQKNHHLLNIVSIICLLMIGLPLFVGS